MVKKQVARAALVAILVAAGWFAWFVGLVGGNIREVSANRLYRSAQLEPQEMRSLLRRHGVRTVINLRGGNPGEHLFDNEVAAAKAEGAEVVSIPLSATHLPPPASMARLIATFHTSGPFLVHCAYGADRSGLACAVYRAVIDHEPVDQAQAEQLTWRYGHLPFGKARPMDEFFDLYRKTGRGTDLETWILNRYPVEYGRR